ncbi:Adenosylcobinamide-phosphate synthase [hydrothermal vent metagenome]|uniref:Adenosylcobinamide-phosphate synthase n=1 Tax=hydrothermal vent metagenome TaxID=652676 RepID=A0A3B1ANK1_9ZZZZ
MSLWSMITAVVAATGFSVALAMLLDYLLGEPRRWHPLVGFGRLVSWLEQRLWRADSSPLAARLRGILSVALLLIPISAGVFYISQFEWLATVLGVLVLYLAIGGRSLAQHAMQVRDALRENNTVKARAMAGRLVSRDTRSLNETQISNATVESVLENGCDAVFAALFWFVIAGAPGVIFYRLANTLDAMWGYRNERYQHFGWAAARLDDVLNFIPARLTALTYAVLGEFQKAIRCWRQQAYSWKSPNAGPVMAAGAGALSLQLGGAATYHGELQQRPPLGLDKLPQASDIQRAVRLVNRGMLLWLLVIVIGGWLFV